MGRATLISDQHEPGRYHGYSASLVGRLLRVASLLHGPSSVQAAYRKKPHPHHNAGNTSHNYNAQRLLFQGNNRVSRRHHNNSRAHHIFITRTWCSHLCATQNHPILHMHAEAHGQHDQDIAPGLSSQTLDYSRRHMQQCSTH